VVTYTGHQGGLAQVPRVGMVWGGVGGGRWEGWTPGLSRPTFLFCLVPICSLTARADGQKGAQALGQLLVNPHRKNLPVLSGGAGGWAEHSSAYLGLGRTGDFQAVLTKSRA
jgi:hypothetical protein